MPDSFQYYPFEKIKRGLAKVKKREKSRIRN